MQPAAAYCLKNSASEAFALTEKVSARTKKRLKAK